MNKWLTSTLDKHLQETATQQLKRIYLIGALENMKWS